MLRFPTGPAPTSAHMSHRASPTPIVILGGDDLDACKALVQSLPARCGLALVVAFGRQDGLVAALTARAQLPVNEVRAPTELVPDHVYVIPTDLAATLHGGALVLAPSQDIHAPLDRLLRSAALEAGRQTTAVLLGGRGTDGILGMKRVKEAGGLTIVQLPDGEQAEMPRAVIATGFVDLVLPIAEIPARVLEIVRESARLRSLDEDTEDDATAFADTLRDILTLVRLRTGHDFSAYKRATLYRRVARRMQVCQAESIGAYHQYLREHPDELPHLLRDFLISVTSFFRDPEAFDALAAQVIPRLFAGKRVGDQVRVWVSGCATGEEAYSIAILLCEHASAAAQPRRRSRSSRPTSTRRRSLEARAALLPGDDRRRRLARAPRSVLPARERPLPGPQGAARAGAVLAAQPAARSAVLAARPDQLPQPAHLPQPRRAGSRAQGVPLRAPRRGVSVPRARPSRRRALRCSTSIDAKHRLFTRRPTPTAARASTRW